MKKNKLGIKIGLGILIIVILALIGVIIWGIKSGNGFTFFEKPVIIYDNTFEKIASINVDVTSYDVELKESNNDIIKVEISGSKKNQDKFHVEEENGNLTINENGSSVCIGFCLDGTITIYLPNQDITYHHKSSSGNIYSDIDLRSVVINTTSGDITLKNINDGTISSTSGNINVANANKLNVSATSGDISLDETKNIIANTKSGNIEVRSITSKMDITTTSGDINIFSLSIKEDSKAEAKSGNIDIKLDKDVFIDATTRSGNIDIDNTNTNPTLIIKTTSGDITAK
mgnify:CR=1 FL=1